MRVVIVVRRSESRRVDIRIVHEGVNKVRCCLARRAPRAHTSGRPDHGPDPLIIARCCTRACARSVPAAHAPVWPRHTGGRAALIERRRQPGDSRLEGDALGARGVGGARGAEVKLALLAAVCPRTCAKGFVARTVAPPGQVPGGESGSPSPYMYLKQASSSKHTKVPIQAHPSSCLLACSLSPLEPGREAYEVSVRNGRKSNTSFGGNPGENAANRSSEGPELSLTTRVLSLTTRPFVRTSAHAPRRTVPSRWLRAADLSIDEKPALALIGDGGQRRQ